MTSIHYGISGQTLDVTKVVLEMMGNEESFMIPRLDAKRAQLFGDPLPKCHKVHLCY